MITDTLRAKISRIPMISRVAGGSWKMNTSPTKDQTREMYAMKVTKPLLSS
jgi:hypothetical protein